MKSFSAALLPIFACACTFMDPRPEVRPVPMASHGWEENVAVVGRLAWDGECLIISERGIRYLPIWSYATRANSHWLVTSIPPDAPERRLRIGERLRLTGRTRPWRELDPGPGDLWPWRDRCSALGLPLFVQTVRRA